jgi:toxin YoeB
MKAVWHPTALDQLAYWVNEDPKIAAKILALVMDARRQPFSGLGKPESLKGRLAGWWSRRITDEHRLVYRVTGTGAAQTIEIAQCRFHYS